MKVALLKPPATYADWYKRPVLGLSYICAYLEKNGFNCKIFDAYYNLWSDKELINNVIDYKPDFIGITAMTHEINCSAQIALMLKKQIKSPIIIGGCQYYCFT
jgi:methanogenic corrinoid protein MtbC1